MRLLLLLVAVAAVSSFNIDTKNAVVHRNPRGSFGYSLDFFYEQKGMPMLVVGAPDGETTNPKLRGIRRPGAVYSCSTNRATCREVHVDQKEGNMKGLNGSVMVPIEDKAYQFFGATVKANNKHDRLLMCAPKYKYFFRRFEVIEPVGTCFYTANGFENAKEYASCRQEPLRHGRHRFGYGQCGFSAAIPDRRNKKDDRVFIGAPGVFYWQGAIFSQGLADENDRLNTSYAHDGKYDHDMMGYATATGDLNGDGEDDIVAGLPRGDGLSGKLVLYTSRLKWLQNITDPTGSQTGQYCGSSLAVADVNKDGRDDIIVGCPFYTDYVSVKDDKTQERKPQYDVGKVIIFYQTAPGVFDKHTVIVGEQQHARFGYSVASAGDLNQDGYNDFIVGAPYAGKDSRGSVYVMHGGKDGVRQKYTQRIEAPSIDGQLHTFGFSVTGGVDVDGNGIPDIAAGGWKSGSAVVMLSKPVVTVTGQSDADSALINIEDRNCEVDHKLGRQACRTINTCLKYEGRGDTPNDLEFILKYNLDDQSNEQRAYFLQKDIQQDRDIKVGLGSKSKDHPNVIERRIRLEKNRQKCFKQRFFASSTMRDKLSPIHWSINYTYIESKTGKLRGDKLEPAIDNTVPLSFENKINIANNCGKDDVCIPDLRVTAVADRQKFLLGTKDNTMLVNVTVRNGGEDSYETRLYFDVPEGFEYSGIESSDQKTAPVCSPTTDAPEDDGTWTFGCDLGNPLPANKVVSNIVRITASTEKPPLKPIEINAHVNSSNEELATTASDNKVTFTIPVDFKNQLLLNGRSEPEQVDFSTSNRTKAEIFYDREIGPVVSHLYQLSNRGPSEIDAATLDIFWPSFSTEGNHLLYIITEPVVTPNKGRCRVKQSQNINPLNLRITNEHVPTKPPPTAAHPTDAVERDYSAEEDDYDSELPAPQHQPDHREGGHVVQGPMVYEPNSNAEEDLRKYGQIVYKDNEYRPQGRYEYVEDDEYDDEEDEDYDAKKRLKREARRKSKKQGLAPGGEGRPTKARHADLREAVKLSKESGGSIDYKGPISRASVDCNALSCTHIECDLYNIEEGQFVLVEIFSRLYTNTMVDERNSGGEISSLGVARVTSTKFNWPHKPTLVTAVTTAINAIEDKQLSGVPWWLYLIAILIGLLLLIALILLLKKCGFFKRNRPHAEHAERRAVQDPDSRYADTKTRYNQVDTYNYDNHGQML